MKTFNIILVLLTATLFAGCQSSRVVLRPAQTRDVAIVSTNAVPQVTQSEVVRTELNPIPGGPELRFTNLVTLTNLVTRVETNIIRVIVPEVAYTNVSFSPALTAGVQVAGELAPVPWAGAASGIFGIVSGAIFGFINNKRKREAIARADEKEVEAVDWEKTAGVLVENVEAVRRVLLSLPSYTKEMDLKVVRGLEVAQRVANVKPKVDALVEARTEDTVPI